MLVVPTNLHVLFSRQRRRIRAGPACSPIPIRPMANGKRRSPTGLSSTGWGGRIADSLQTVNSGAQFPPITSIAGCGLFCTGQQTLPASVPSSGPVQLTGILNNPNRTQAMQQLLSFDNGVQLVQAGNGILTRGSNYANTLAGLIGSVTINTPFPSGNPLAAQLLMVAKLIGLRGQLGLTRQIFSSVPSAASDTHGDQLATQASLLGQLSFRPSRRSTLRRRN